MTAQMEFTSETTARCVGCDMTWEGSGGGGRYLTKSERLFKRIKSVTKRRRNPITPDPVETHIHYGEFTFGSMTESVFVPATDDELEWGNYGDAFRCDNCGNVFPTEQWTWDAVQGAEGVVVVDAIAIKG